MIELMTNPAVTHSQAIFQRCVSEISSEGNMLGYIKNEISGNILNRLEPKELSNNVWENTLRLIERSKNNISKKNLDPSLKDLPISLQNYLSNIEVSWKKFGDVKVARLSEKNELDKLELIHVMPNGGIPQHTHEGRENFLVLHGSYSDEYGTYSEGTVQIRDEDHDHKPIGDSETGCIGLAYTEGKIKFSGKFSKFLNFFNN
jgi:putative transcriptional regulator